MELATVGLFRAKWTNQIHEEWIENLLEKREDLTKEQLYRTRDSMNDAVMDCLVLDYEGLIDSITLPDQNDRHVLAAAIKSGPDAIITFNLRDFPESELKKYNVEPQHPDDFIYHQFGLDQARVLIAAQKVRGRLRNPPKSPKDYLETLLAQQLPKTVAELQPYLEIL
jgi:hypothetical protein